MQALVAEPSEPHVWMEIFRSLKDRSVEFLAGHAVTDMFLSPPQRHPLVLLYKERLAIESCARLTIGEADDHQLPCDAKELVDRPKAFRRWKMLHSVHRDRRIERRIPEREPRRGCPHRNQGTSESREFSPLKENVDADDWLPEEIREPRGPAPDVKKPSGLACEPVAKHFDRGEIAKPRVQQQPAIPLQVSPNHLS